jgi:multiple sugar transport system permease protein
MGRRAPRRRWPPAEGSRLTIATEVPAIAAAGASTRPTADRRRPITGILLTAPALGALGATMLYPVLWTLWLSLNGPNTAMRGAPDFRGLDNYGRIAASTEFQQALGQTLGITAATFILEAVVGLAVALALHRGLRGSKVFRAIIALPLMVAPVVGALAWRFIFADGYGLIDSLLAAVGADGPLWFADVWLARATIVIANLWMALPFDILVLLAGLASLPTEPIEAAQVDGASPAQILISIILPLLKPVIAVIVVIRVADAFRIFDVVYVLTGAGPANTTEVLSTYIYRQMFTVFDFPGGAAAAMLLVLLTATFSLVAVLLLRSRR